MTVRYVVKLKDTRSKIDGYQLSELRTQPGWRIVEEKTGAATSMVFARHVDAGAALKALNEEGIWTGEDAREAMTRMGRREFELIMLNAMSW